MNPGSESFNDAVTGLPDRRGFFVLAEHLVRSAARSKKGFWIGRLGVEGAKEVEAAHGRAEGDRLVKQAALVLRGTLRGSDVVAHFGDGEFAVVAIDCKAEDLEILRGRLAQGLADFNASSGSKVALGMGWAWFDPKTLPPFEAILSRADQSLRDSRWAKRD